MRSWRGRECLDTVDYRLRPFRPVDGLLLLPKLVRIGSLPMILGSGSDLPFVQEIQGLKEQVGSFLGQLWDESPQVVSGLDRNLFLEEDGAVIDPLTEKNSGYAHLFLARKDGPLNGGCPAVFGE